MITHKTALQVPEWLPKKYGDFLSSFKLIDNAEAIIKSMPSKILDLFFPDPMKNLQSKDTVSAIDMDGVVKKSP